MENYEYTRPSVNRNSNAKIRKLRRKTEVRVYIYAYGFTCEYVSWDRCSEDAFEFID